MEKTNSTESVKSPVNSAVKTSANTSSAVKPDLDGLKSMDVKTRNQKYAEYVSRISPRTRPWPSLFWAFLIGGLICIIGEAIKLGFIEIFPEYDEASIGSLTSTVLILVAAIMTGIGIYDRIGNIAGGGSIVPITGYSNSMTAAAIEYRKEGIIFGTCANMFKIAGPVIVVGIALSMLVGSIYYIVGLFG